MKNLLKYLKDYLSVIIAVITLIVFLVSIKIDGDYTRQRADEIYTLLQDHVEKIVDIDKRLTVIEKTK